MTKTVEYRVIPVTRYFITRYEREDDGPRQSGGCGERGEFDSREIAIDTAKLLASAEPGAAFAEVENRPLSTTVSR